MNLSIEQIISIISAVSLSTFMSIVFTFIQVNKKNNIDYITRERSQWRKNLKKILVDLDDESERELAVEKLKSQINPYGKNIDIKNTPSYFMKEGHIWDLLEGDEGIDYEKLSYYIALMLKYDWERSKQEISFDGSKFLKKLIRWLLILITIYNFFHVQDSQFKLVVIGLVLLLVFLQETVTKELRYRLPKNNSMQLWVFTIFHAFPYVCNFMMLRDKVGFLQSASTMTLGLLIFCIYEAYFLLSFSSGETEYIREIEKCIEYKNSRDAQAILLYNRINQIENRLNKPTYDEIYFNREQKRLKRLKKKLLRKKRPKEYLLHLKLLYKYYKNQKRIGTEVKKILNLKEN